MIATLALTVSACGGTATPGTDTPPPTDDPIPNGLGRLVVTTEGLPNGVEAFIIATRLVEGASCGDESCTADIVDLTGTDDLEPGRYAVTAQGATDPGTTALTTQQTRIRIYVPQGTGIEVEVLEGDTVDITIIFTATDVDADAVTFDDSVFESAVRAQLGIPTGSITTADMATLTLLDVTSNHRAATSMTGLEHATNLRTLYIGGTEIEDLTPLASLDALEYLYAWKWGTDSAITNITPLADHTGMRILDLAKNDVQDVSALGGMTNLEDAWLALNRITDVAPLQNLTSLERLDLALNDITDISALDGLTNLVWLSLNEQNKTDNTLRAIDDISPLANMPDLEHFALRNNVLEDIGPLAELTNLRFLDLTDNRVRDLRPLEGLTNLTTLRLCCGMDAPNGGLTSVLSLQGLTNLEELTIHENSLTDITAIAELPNLQSIDVNSNCLAVDTQATQAALDTLTRRGVTVTNTPVNQRSMQTCVHGAATDVTELVLSERPYVGGWTRTRVQAFMRDNPDLLVYVRPDQTLTYADVAALTPPADILFLDVIDLGNHSTDLVDLATYFALSTVADASIPTVATAGEVNSALLGVAAFTDIGVLYYRSDLLAEDGDTDPPATWDELQERAAAIQASERASGNADFHGFVWPGIADEGLTVSALEWIASHGGGTFIENGTVTIYNRDAVEALSRAAAWTKPDGISPTNTLTLGEAEARQAFLDGNAAFLRSWPYAYAMTQEIPSLVGNVGVTTIPGVTAETGGGALGGWYLAITNASPNPDAAARVIAYLTSESSQRAIATQAGVLPSREALYAEPAIADTILPLGNPVAAVTGASIRPSADTGSGTYVNVSTIIVDAIAAVLAGETTADAALTQAQGDIEAETGFETP